MHDRLQEAGEVGDNVRLKGFHSVDDDEEKVRMNSPGRLTQYLKSLLFQISYNLSQSPPCLPLVDNYLNLTSVLLFSLNPTRPFPSLSYPTHKQDTTVVGADLIRLHLHLNVANDDTEDEMKFEVKR